MRNLLADPPTFEILKLTLMDLCTVQDENVIIDNRFSVRLIDFGSAVVFQPGQLFATFYGTVEYCAPEVLKGTATLVILLNFIFIKVWCQVPFFLIFSFSYIHKHILTVHLFIPIIHSSRSLSFSLQKFYCQYCESLMFIRDPDCFHPGSRIPDPGSWI